MTQRDWQKDMEIQIKMKNCAQKSGFKTEEEDAAIYWMIQARERGEREQRLKELLSDTMGCLVMSTSKDNEDVARIAADYSTLFPDTPTTPEIKQQSTARTLDDWHEDIGTVLWWTFPIEEPPYCGTPLDADYPDYLTHWTPIVEPAAPAPKEGE